MTERDRAIRTDGIYIRRLEDSWSVIRFCEMGLALTGKAVNVDRRTAEVAEVTRTIAGWLVPGGAGAEEGSFELDGERILLAAGGRRFEGTVREEGSALLLRWEGSRRWYGATDRDEGSWHFSALVEDDPPPASQPSPGPAPASPAPDTVTADAAEADAACAAGISLAGEGKPLEAEAAFRRADELGSADGALRLGLLLEARGALAPAVGAYDRADERGSALGAYHYGMNVERTGGDKLESIRALVRAEQRGYRQATAILDQMVAPLPGEHPLSLESRRAQVREM
ncbi:MAG TPA: hypothetical protein VJU14_09135 [Solirubrobacterales bacterium]|nr:hypothetical protein [Solirubrobacterales bacterium]